MNSKCVNVIKPCQSGKTFYTIQKIADFLDDGEEKSIIVIFCDNKLLLVDQTTSRIETASELDIYKNDEGDLSVILSSKSETKHIQNVHFAISEKGIRNVVLCSNKARMRDLSTLLGYRSMREYKFYIVIDEVDKTINAFHEFIEEWAECSNVSSIYMLTATPEKLLKKYDTINVIPMEETFVSHMYHGFKDCNFVLHNAIKDTSAEDYLADVMDTYPNYFQPGTVLFAPGNVRKDTHYNNKDILLNHGFVVLCVNGDGKTLYLNKHISEEINPEKCEVFADWVAKLYEKYELNNAKFAITGNLCIERGITISSQRMMITHAVLPPNIISTPDAYQLSGRLCGNFKQFTNYIIPVVFCTKMFQKKVLECERKAMNIAVQCFRESPDAPSQITKEDMKNSGKEKETFKVNVELHEFHSLDAVLKFQRQHNMRKFVDPTRSMVNGFYQTSLAAKKNVYSYTEIKNWLNGIDAKSNFDIKKTPEDAAGYYVSRLYIGYENISDPATARFVLRVGHVTIP